MEGYERYKEGLNLVFHNLLVNIIFMKIWEGEGLKGMDEMREVYIRPAKHGYPANSCKS